MKNTSPESFLEGIQTFMKADYISLDQAAGYDVSFLGIPLEIGVSYRGGTKYGPKSVREHSFQDGLNYPKYYDTSSNNYLTPDDFSIGDLGDIHIAPTDFEKTHHLIKTTIRQIRTNSFPLIAGGDHSIAYSTISGCLSALHDQHKGNIAVLHFDAHLDNDEEYLDLPRIYHGNPFRLLIEEEIIRPENLYSVGPRGLIGSHMVDFAKARGVNFFSMDEIRKTGFHKFVQWLIADLKERFEGVYISFDMDFLDPTEIKGTGTPVENGVTTEEAYFLMRSMKPLPTIGFELVELSPPLDPTGYSSVVATNILWHFLNFGLKGRGRTHLCG